MRRRLMDLSGILLLTTLLAACSVFRANQPAAPAPPPPAPAAATPAVPPADARPVIVCFGDSLTYGLGVEEKESYPSQLQRRLDGEGYRYRVVNLGISGDTSAGGLSRLQSALDLHPQLMILELGANDGLRGLPVSEMSRNLAQIVEKTKAAGVTVVLAGMQMPPNLGPDYTAAFARVFPDLAAQYKLSLVPFFLNDVGGVRGLNQADGIHPTAAGYKLVVDNVWKTLKPLLQK